MSTLSAPAFFGAVLLLAPLQVQSRRLAVLESSAESLDTTYEAYDEAVTQAAKLLIQAEELNDSDTIGLQGIRRDIDVALDEANRTLQQAERLAARSDSSSSFMEEEDHPLSRKRDLLNPLEWTRYLAGGPAQEDVRALQEWGSQLGMTDTSGIGELSLPADELYDAALAKYIAAGADVSRDEIALSNILGLHFRHRQGFSVTHATRETVFHELASDFAELEAKRNRLAHGDRFQERHSGSSGLGPGFDAYFQGLAAQRGRSKPTALIFTCSFGGGHKSAGEAVGSYLADLGYDSKMIDTTRDPSFVSLDQKVSDIMFNKVVLAHQWYALFNIVDKGQQAMGILTKECQSPNCDTERKRRFRNAILAYHPDLVVTVYHMEVMLVTQLVRELGSLPYLHIATDIDIKMREVFESSRPPIYPRMMVGVPFNLQASWATVPPLQRAQTFLAGYPVRRPFLKAGDPAAAQTEKLRRYPQGCRLVLVMSGGGGQKTPWPAMLGDYGLEEEPERPIHVVVIAGSDNTVLPALQEELPGRVPFFPGSGPIERDGQVFWDAMSDSDTEVLLKEKQSSEEPLLHKKSKLPKVLMQGRAKHVTVEVATGKVPGKPFFINGEELALLMDMADLVITKPGGGSTAEVAYRGPPAVFDGSHGLLHWESFTAAQFDHLDRGRLLVENDVERFQDICKKALALGRSTVIAEEDDGPGTPKRLINPVEKIKGALEAISTQVCDRCEVFFTDAH